VELPLQILRWKRILRSLKRRFDLGLAQLAKYCSVHSKQKVNLMKLKLLESLLLAFGLLFIEGCATTSPVDSQARAICIRTFGTDTYFRMLWLSDTHVEAFASTFMGYTGPQLDAASAMEAGHDKRVDLVVWAEPGVSPSATIDGGLRYIPETKRLDQLNFLFVGDTNAADYLRGEVEARGAKFYFHPLPSQ
jgi:hypothetical protein